MNLKKKILAFLSSEEPTVEVVTLAEEKLENGTILVSDEFKEGAQVFIKSEDEGEENVALPVGEYELENGSILVVEVEGEISSIGEAKEDEVKEESTDEEVSEDLAEEPTEEPTEEVVSDDPMEALLVVISELESRIAALEGPKEELAEEVVVEEVKVEELSKEDEEEAKPIVHTPEASEPRKAKFYFPKN